MRSLPRVFHVVIPVVVALAAAGITAITSAEEATASSHGLFRDVSGDLWCGSSCSSGQQCCGITLYSMQSVGGTDPMATSLTD